MSDFGATITISKKNGEAFTEAEAAHISTACTTVQEQTTLKNSFSEPYLFKLGLPDSIASGTCLSLDILLSNHWGDADQYKWHKVVEIKDARIIAKDLATAIGKAYKCKANYSWW